jgi:hypothetical protein
MQSLPIARLSARDHPMQPLAQPLPERIDGKIKMPLKRILLIYASVVAACSAASAALPARIGRSSSASRRKCLECSRRARTAARQGRYAGAAAREVRCGRNPRCAGDAHQGCRRDQSALRGVGIHPPPQGGCGIRRPNRLCAYARHGPRGHRSMGARLLWVTVSSRTSSSTIFRTRPSQAKMHSSKRRWSY